VFGEAQFAGDALFGGARFEDKYTDFVGAQFDGSTQFGGGGVFGEAWFGRGAGSGESALFTEAWFDGDADFRSARARPTDSPISHSWPAGWIIREPVDGEEEGWLYLLRVENSTEK
jgi:hypothetical protein